MTVVNLNFLADQVQKSEAGSVGERVAKRKVEVLTRWEDDREGYAETIKERVLNWLKNFETLECTLHCTVYSEIRPHAVLFQKRPRIFL